MISLFAVRVLVAVIASISLAHSVFADCHNYKSWDSWRSQFESLCAKQGIKGSAVSGDKDLHAEYCRNNSAAQAFYLLGGDATVFEKVWMPRVRQIVRAHGGKIENHNEAMEEWLWLQFFLEQKKPESAARVILDRNPYAKIGFSETAPHYGIPWLPDAHKTGFQKWLEKVTDLAAIKHYEICWDEEYFLSYYQKGYTPEEAIWHWVHDPWPNMGGGA